MKSLSETYQFHDEMPYVDSRYELELLEKPIAKKQMVRTKEGLLPGQIILLWRIQFGTYLTSSQPHKYFYTTYGIDPVKGLEELINLDLVKIDSAKDSLKQCTSMQIRKCLKDKKIKGLSKMKRQELDYILINTLTDKELEQFVTVRSYSLTSKGKEVLEHNQSIVEGHPKKKY